MVSDALALLIAVGVAFAITGPMLWWIVSSARSKKRAVGTRQDAMRTYVPGQRPPFRPQNAWWPLPERAPGRMGRERGPSCPRCQSRATLHKGVSAWWLVVGLFSLLILILVVMLIRRPVHCYTCGYDWDKAEWGSSTHARPRTV